jgi:hypothetical protein
MSDLPPAATKAALPVSRRRWRQRLAAAARWLHIYTSVVGLVAILFFSATGLTLNHPDWMLGSVQRQQEYHGQLQADWLGTVKEGAPATPLNQLRIVEFLRKTHQLHGEVDDFRETDTDGSFAFKGPGYSADVFFDRSTGKYDVSESAEGLVAVMNDFHKGRHTGKSWSLAIDLTAILLIIVSFSGLILLCFIKRRRLSGGLLAVLGGLILLGIAWWLVP